MFLEIHKDHVMKKLTNSVQMTLRYAELSNQGIKHLNNVISCVKRWNLYWIVPKLFKENYHTSRLKNWHFQISSVFMFNIWFKIFQRCYLKIIFVYLNWVELHSLLRSIISIATHFILIYSWFNLMASESFGLVRI